MRNISDFELVIFDCDGVLVDSERITNRIFAGMLRELGISVTLDDMFERFIGHSMGQCLDAITEMLGHAPPPGFVEDYRARTRAALELEIKPVPGIEAALDAIGLPCCVASSGEPEKMRLTLGVTGLLPRFEDRLFSVAEVARSKPAPDIFLHVARRCGADPSACVVIEDTPTGVAAGVAAGMTVYGYSALTPSSRLSDAGAHRIFDDMAELPALIEIGFSPNRIPASAGTANLTE